jgi:hypothetical protein
MASGFVDIYTGAQPSTGDSSVTGTKLVSLSMGSTAVNSPSSGAMTNKDWNGTAIATGTAGYFVMYESDHATVLMMGSVGTSGCNLNLGTTTINSADVVDVANAAFTITEDASVSGQ